MITYKVPHPLLVAAGPTQLITQVERLGVAAGLDVVAFCALTAAAKATIAMRNLDNMGVVRDQKSGESTNLLLYREN